MVITSTARIGDSFFPFEIVRRPPPSVLIRLVRWSEIVFHNNISLRVAWPLLFIRRPWVIAHHQWFSRPDNSVGLRDHAKQFLLRFSTNIAISQPMADHLSTPSVIIPNPYRNEVFKRDDKVRRDQDLLFVGRLVPDKGVDLLLEAMNQLRKDNLRPKLTVIGKGPAEGALRGQVERLQLADQVEFIGPRTGQKLVEELNRHQVIVVPSRFEEPFGLVAIEGVACGCRAIVAACGGLKSVLGPLAILFETGNSVALAKAIKETFKGSFDWESYWRSADEWIRGYHANRIALRYLDVFEEALRSRPATVRRDLAL